jgi:hypothetical protein
MSGRIDSELCDQPDGRADHHKLSRSDPVCQFGGCLIDCAAFLGSAKGFLARPDADHLPGNASLLERQP